MALPSSTLSLDVNTTEKPDALSIIRDLIFGESSWVLAIVEYTVALLFLGLVAAVVYRAWRGDRLECFGFKIERSEQARELKASLDEIDKDDKVKKNVLWMFRERLNEANAIISDGIEDWAVRHWCRGALTDIVTALSEGAHDRHRASLWIRHGDTLRMYNGMGFRQEAVDHATLPPASVAGNVLATGAKCNFGDVEREASFSPKPRSGQAYRSLLGVPVKTPDGRTIAALCVDAEAQGYFDSDHEFFASCFADLIALLLAQVVTGDET